MEKFEVERDFPWRLLAHFRLLKIAPMTSPHMRKYIMRFPVAAESRQNLKSIEISFNSSHRGKIALYLDRIH